jgi:hypothetical protein
MLAEMHVFQIDVPWATVLLFGVVLLIAALLIVWLVAKTTRR